MPGAPRSNYGAGLAVAGGASILDVHAFHRASTHLRSIA
jgi:hypothetical protein